MSATRYPVVDRVDPHVVERLHIVDPGGDELVVRRLRDDDDGFVAMLDTGTAPVALDVDDALALLSFLADAAGVERVVPDAGRCQSVSGGSPADNVPCLLPTGHDGWHKGLAATWSGS